MVSFSTSSKLNLDTCDTALQLVFMAVVKNFDCGITCGYRNKDKQDAAVREHKSKTPWPESKHNSYPSRAVDVLVFVNGRGTYDERAYRFFAGAVIATALSLGVKIRWGGDWDGDIDPADQSFNDLCHFELIE